MKDTVFRKVTPDDIDWLYTKEAIKMYYYWTTQVETRACNVYIDIMKEYICEDSVDIYVCLFQGVRVGLLVFQKKRNYGYSIIRRIVVREDYRFLGIGRYMITQLIKEYAGGYRIWANEVPIDSIGFFRKCEFGWETEEEHIDAQGKSLGVYYSCCLWI